MTARKLLLLVIALVVGVGTFHFARTLLEDARRPAAADAGPSTTAAVPLESVLVAASDLPVGTLIRADDLRWQPWPAEGGSLDAYTVEGDRALDEFVGAVVRRGLRAGEPITAGRLVKPGERGFLAAVLEPQMRAVSVPINGITGIAGFVFPGDRVDLILTHAVTRPEDPVLPNRWASETVLTDVRVLAIDQKTDDQTGKPAIAQLATLEVTPKDAELVALAMELGELSLSLRSLVGAEPADPTLLASGIMPVVLEEGSTEAAPDSVRGYTWDSDVSLVLPQPSDGNRLVNTVRVMRGGEASELTFDRR